MKNKLVQNIDVVILCGGKGTRLSEETNKIPKPMVEIGGKPILWHIMKIYSYYGYNRFILALGYKSNYIKEYFYNLRITGRDFTLNLNPMDTPEYLNTNGENDWEITFIDTGEETLKGGRIKKIEKYIQSEDFHLTYGDGVSDVNIGKLVDFHKSHEKLGTVTAVRPPSRFGAMEIKEDTVIEFEEKPQMRTGFINGGFFIFKKKMLSYLTPAEDCDFEFGALQNIAKERQLKAFKHDGFWQCMDNIRERNYLNELVINKQAPWMNWK